MIMRVMTGIAIMIALLACVVLFAILGVISFFRDRATAKQQEIREFEAFKF